MGGRRGGAQQRAEKGLPFGDAGYTASSSTRCVATGKGEGEMEGLAQSGPASTQGPPVTSGVWSFTVNDLLCLMSFCK